MKNVRRYWHSSDMKTLEGELLFWKATGRIDQARIDVNGISVEQWLAQALEIPIDRKGHVERGRYGRIRLTVEKL